MACTPICLRGARRPVTARRWRSAALVLAALVSTAASAQDPPQIDSPAPAQPGRRVSLHWNAPAGPCPGEPELLARIDALVDAAPLQLDATAWVQQLAVPTPAGEAWRLDLRLQWSQRSDTRILHARDCSSLADATVVLPASRPREEISQMLSAGIQDITNSMVDERFKLNEVLRMVLEVMYRALDLQRANAILNGEQPATPHVPVPDAVATAD